VQDRIPLKQTYLFTGNGAVGKSLVDLQRAVAHVLGKPWLGMPVRQGPAIYMGAEDDKDELHIRLAAILEYYGATFADVIAGGLHLLSYVGEDCMLGVPDKRGIVQPTRGRLKSANRDHSHRSKIAGYSITSSARCWSWSGTSRPSALAVFRLMISATLIGIWIGSSAAFSPLRMRSMYPAAWGYCSPKSPP
jgi:AAA domain